MITAAIADSPHYSEAFKNHETQKFTRAYLRGLIDSDPHFVSLAQTADGTAAGFIISGPEFGVIVIYWCYLLPKHRLGTLATRSMRAFIEHWDHGRFHKIVAYTKPDNRAPQLLMKRNGFHNIALLEKHIFGEDYMLFERPLSKRQPGYQGPINVGARGKLMAKVYSLLGRA